MNGYDESLPLRPLGKPKPILLQTLDLPRWLQDAVMQYPQKPVHEQVKAFQLSLERMLDLGNSKRWTLYCTLAAWLRNHQSSKQEEPSYQRLAGQDLGPLTYNSVEPYKLIDTVEDQVRAATRRISQGLAHFVNPWEYPGGSLWLSETSPK